MEGIELTAEVKKVSGNVKKALRFKYPRKLKKAIKKAWRFEDDAFMTHVTFEPVVIKNNKMRHKVMGMMKIDKNGLNLPLWNGSFIRFSQKWDKVKEEEDEA